MTDDLMKWLRANISVWDHYYDMQKEAASRIEKLEASESEWQPICDSYAAENQRFFDRIEKLEAALREIAEISDFRSTHPMSSEADYFRIARKALEGKDE